MASSSRPAWLVEALDVLDRRASLLRGVVLAGVLVGVLLAFLAPDVLPPHPLVGAAVAVVAIVLGVAVALAVDAGDGTVRGPRHVRSAGGELVGVLPTRVTSAAAGDLADAVLEARDGHRVVLGVAPAGDGADVGAWTDALGVAIAARHASVLIVDLVAGATPQDGLVEVVFEGVSLGHSVTFERDVKLARLGAGRDLDRAIVAAAELPTRLPKDLEVLLLALPPVVDPDVISVVEALDAVLLVARSDRTPRVRLQTAIEAVRTVGTTAQVVLVDDDLAAAPRPAARSAGEEPSAPGAAAARSTGPTDDDHRDTPVAAGTGPTDVGTPRAMDPGRAAGGTTADLGAVIAAGAGAAGAAEQQGAEPDERSHRGPDPDPDLRAAAPVEPDPQPTAGSEPLAASAEHEAAPPAHPEPDDPLEAGSEPASEPGPGPVEAASGSESDDATADARPVADAEPEAAGASAEPAVEPSPDEAPPTAPSGPRSITGRDVAADEADDPWTRPRTTPREELGRRPSPSVRVVRDLPPSARSPRPGLADPVPPVPPATTAAGPRDPDLVSGAAAAGLAARLSGPEPATPPEAPTPPGPQDTAPTASGPDGQVADPTSGPVEAAPAPAPAPAPAASPEPEPSPEVAPEPEPAPEVAPEPEPSPEVAPEPEPAAEVAPEPEPAAEVAPEPEPAPEVAPEPEPAPEVAPEPGPDPGPDPASVEDDEVVDPTDEIPAVRDARLARAAPEDDPLRTTAQLAMLMDELNGRDDEDDPSAP